MEDSDLPSAVFSVITLIKSVVGNYSAFKTKNSNFWLFLLLQDFKVCVKFLLLLQTQVMYLSGTVLEFLILNILMRCKALGKLQADCGVCLD